MDFPKKVPCIKSIQAGKFCWLEAVGSTTLDADLQDNILLCKECSTFKDLLGRGFGRRKADLALGETVADLLKLVADRNESLTNAQQRLERLLEEMVLLKTITDSLVKTRDLHRALRIILTGVTSGRAFEFNRAGIFLVDKRNEYLTGEYAIGPGNHAQAREIWDRISLTTFQDQIRAIIDIADLEHDSLREIIQTIKIPLSDKNNVFVKALWADKAIFYKRSDLDKSMVDRILKFTDFNEFVIIPLRTENQPVGILLADNYFTGKPITDSSILALETLANTCSSFLENTLLHRELSDRLKELEHVNKLLRENQNYLVQTQRLADIGKIATAVAHEIKTPLATIGGYAHRALKNIKSDKFDKHDLEIIVSETKRLESITAELLEYSKQVKLQTKLLSINRMVRDSLSILEHKLTSSGIKLKMNLDTSDPQARLDEGRIMQVIFNLVDNAIDAMKPGQVLTISTSCDAATVILEIQDNGSGVPPELQDKMFSLFFTTKPHGTGLGLPVSKRIVDDHGGKIEFESQPGKGTRFLTYFPRAY